MGNNQIFENIFKELNTTFKGKIKLNEHLKDYTYFKIGGPVSLFAEPEDIGDIIEIFKIIRKHKVNYYIIGNGTNLLVSDDGFEGIIIKIGQRFNKIEVKGNTITAKAGALLSVLSNVAAKNELTGLEFASGIPGYLGGACVMNAGAYGGEMKDVITKVVCVDLYGDIHEFTNEEMKFGYRKSIAQQLNLMIIEAEFELEKGDKVIIEDKMRDLNIQRTSKQPLNMPSAGSTFKRPIRGYASKLIEDAGLKGLIYRGAMVSDKHSGFIVNYHDATCDDVLNLMRIVINTVKEKFGVILEPEIKIIGTKL